jgi:hypothetical protein
VLDSLRGEESIAELCRQEGILHDEYEPSLRAYLGLDI